MLRTRVITAAVLLAVLLAVLFLLPPWAWSVMCSLICGLAAWEWGGLAKWDSKARIAYGCVLGGLCFLLAFFDIDGVWLNIFLCLLAVAAFFWLLAVPFWLWRKWALHKWVAPWVGVVVLVPPALVLMYLSRMSPIFVLMSCSIVWVADIAAYFSGRAFGGKKLAPSISPGKTWAGAVGAVLGVLVYGNALLFISGNFWAFWGNTPIWQLLLMQFTLVVLVALSIIGDLFESLLKRQAGVKDSSHLLPGHGGVLDRIDSLTSMLPCWAAFSLFPFFTLLSLPK
ncbi:MAG: phosphatidate cytidylyltransferase [Azoarcus sp.]|jgi:phosphatidate cytidylyltransferase|nr:phosphatidate cytidylyltransferase [Azoarcus sp.]